LTPPAIKPRFVKPDGADPFPERERVLEALGPAKHLVAEQYGLRLAGRQPNPDGWVSCRAFDREDRHPSASINAQTGVYFDFTTCQILSFFDLIAELSAGMLDWRDAVRQLAGCTPCTRSRTGKDRP
jgi:hypothetical protein